MTPLYNLFSLAGLASVTLISPGDVVSDGGGDGVSHGNIHILGDLLCIFDGFTSREQHMCAVCNVALPFVLHTCIKPKRCDDSFEK